MSKEGEGVILETILCPKCSKQLWYRWLGGAFIKCCVEEDCGYRDMNTSRHNLRKQQQMIWWDDRRKSDT